MAAVTVTAADVRPLEGSVTRRYVAGEALNVGKSVYIASADNKVYLSDGDVSAEAARAIGVVCESFDGETSIAADDPASVVVFGPVSGFSSASPGSYGYVSNTAGAIDTAAGTYSFILGYFETDTIFFVNPGVDDPTSS